MLQDVRDEFASMRAHLFEMIEATGLAQSQQNGLKGLIRTITYDSQASVEAALQRGGNHARKPSHVA